MPELDPQLAAGLKAAKKKPHNFTFVIGSKEKVLLVNKSKISAGDLKAARERAVGGVVIKGICKSDGGDGLVFETMTKTGGTFEKQLTQSIKMSAGLKIPVSVAEKDAVEEVEDEQEEAPVKVVNANPRAPEGKQAQANLKADDAKPGAAKGAEAQQPPAEVDPRLISARATYKDALGELTALLKQLQTDLPNEVALVAGKIKAADPGLAKPVAGLSEKDLLAQLQTYKASLTTLTQLRAAVEDKLGKVRSGKTSDPTGAAKARAATLAKVVKDEVAAALETADEAGRKGIEAKRAVVQKAVGEQQWEQAITAIEDLRAFLRGLKGPATASPGTATGAGAKASEAVLQRARQTWRDDVYKRMEPVRDDATQADVRRLDGLRKAVEAAFQDGDMKAAGTALEALDEVLAPIAEANRLRLAHEAAVRERRERADRILDRLQASRDRANPVELKRVDGLRHPLAEAFKADDLALIDNAVNALEAALGELDPAIVARDKALDDRHKAATDILNTVRALGYKLALDPLDKLSALVKTEQKAGHWDQAEKAMASFDTKVKRLSADMADAVILDGDITDEEEAVETVGFDLRQIRIAFDRVMAGPVVQFTAEVPKVAAALAAHIKKEGNKKKAGPAVPPVAAAVALDYATGRPMLPGSKIFLSVEMRRNQAGERGAEHVVPLDVLDFAAKKSKGKAAATDGGNPAYYFPVGPGKTCTKFLCIVIAGDTMITSYTIDASSMLRKMGFNESQMRIWAEKKAYTRAF